MLVETNYSSEYFRKELERYTPREKYAAKTNTYTVDQGGNVTLRFHKKYKFESLAPFIFTEKVQRTDV